jgi:formylglycine-generating enzyme required for sulfatase activity
MGQTEVTVAAYTRYVMAGGKARNPHWTGDVHPMTGVDWNDAREYGAWQGCACRRRRSGSTPLSMIAWVCGQFGREGKTGRAKKAANRYKLYDMLGNVFGSRRGGGTKTVMSGRSQRG